ncbi:MAG: sulfotransferase family protein [Candidatus Pacearchaeota archaeon]
MEIKKKLKQTPLYEPYKKIKRKIIGKPSDYAIIDNWRVVFFFISKNGNTSLKKVFYKIFFGKDSKDVHYEFPRSRKNPDIKSYFKFAFVRNPYDRIVSCYEDKVKRKFWKEFRELGIKQEDSFKDFVKKISKIPEEKADRHFVSQSYLLTNKKGNLIPDFIGRFENLEGDYKKVCQKLGIKNPPKLPQKNKGKRDKDYRKYYDKETQKLVEERYKKDFELFGYGKEL